jgi:hypothetical protein
MLPEALLLLACSGSKGCSETFSQYKVYNPAVAEAGKQAERLAQPLGAIYWGPLVAVVVRSEGVLNLGTGLNLKMKQSGMEILYSYNF